MGKKGIACVISCAMLLSFYAPFAVKASAEATIVLKLNDAQAAVGEKAHLLQSPPVLVNNVTMVPLRFIGDAMGATT
ncbi:MAG: Copper amine oxidase N-terminal domain, partial [Paenibacillaceae bacterium]|nr:Copper amine oxidase N-terminal domain [Paenibacillaceae bacterium]